MKKTEKMNYLQTKFDYANINHFDLMAHRAGNRKLKRQKTQKKSTQELSGMIQWLIDIAGSENVIEGIFHHITNGDKNDFTLIRTNEKSLPLKPKKVLAFNTKDGSVGHWIYYDSKGATQNSYALGHQNPGTNQFCQTFGLIYLLSDFGVDKWRKKMISAPVDAYPDVKSKIWGDNIKTIIDFWMYAFTRLGVTNWLVNDVCKSLNNDYLKTNAETKRESAKVTPINDDTNKINLKLIVAKLEEIKAHAEEIAKYT